MWTYILESMIWSVGGLIGGYAAIAEARHALGRNDGGRR